MSAADITRSTFVPSDHFSGVRMQQARVQLDADATEQADIQAHLDRALTVDVVGPDGAPKFGGGFALAATPDGTDLAVSPGRGWVDGILCELEGEQVAADNLSANGVTPATPVLDGRELAVHEWVELASSGGAGAVVVRVGSVDPDSRALGFASPVDPTVLPGDVRLRRVVSYATQPDLAEPPHTTRPNAAAAAVLDLQDGTYLAYIDVWERELTALQAPRIREVALGGPDTAARIRIVWQLRLLDLGTEGVGATCDGQLDAWDQLVAPPGGRMLAESVPGSPDDTPCVVPPGGGFQGLENHLYRVQIHDVAANGTTTFVWSRDAGTVAAAWTGASGDELVIGAAPRDSSLGFAGGDWVELTDDTRELAGLPGTLVRLLKAEDETLRIDPGTATGSLDISEYPSHPVVRRWDSPGAVTVQRDTPIELEDGIRVTFPSGGGYRPGDYWLIPARTATADIEWPRDSKRRSLAMPPFGVRHAYARVALVHVSAGALTLTDCLTRFPALTELTAADVAFDNAACALPAAGTVQEALDVLCQERDLRYHNRRLHGWGVVDGLQVHCGPDEDEKNRRHVTVELGYAIDCEGNDLNVDAKAPLDIIDMIGQLPESPLTHGNGDVSLTMALDAQRKLAFAVEKFDPKDKAQEKPPLLPGTLLFDFYDQCVRPVEEFLRQQLTREGDDKLPAGPASQRLTAVTNLLVQPVNPTSGQNVFISKREDEIIRDFYAKLKELLQSETFCAMFDDARELPVYPFDELAMDTIFGVGGHTRLRLRPGGKEAWTLGAGVSPTKPVTRINRYDLAARVLVDVIDPVAGVTLTANTTDTGAGAVQDIAFSPDGKLIYVAVATRNEQNTIFRVGTLTNTGVNWRPTVMICGVKLVTLATTAADPTRVYAIGLHKVPLDKPAKGKPAFRWEGAGLFQIDPEAVDPNLPPMTIADFNPVGHLVVDELGIAVASATAVATAVTSYTSLVQLKLPEGTEIGPRITLPRAGNDDIALARRGQGDVDSVYAVVAPATTDSGKEVVGYTLRSGAELTPTPIRLPDNTAVRLQWVPKALLATSADAYLLRMIDPDANTLVKDYVLPLQVGPIAIAADPKGSTFVLNQVSNTLSMLPPKVVDPAFRFVLDDLIDYRKDMLEAFTDLAAGFLQYLKDCFCELLMVDPPKCEGDERIHLACVSVRDNHVRKVCNFTKRRYVKTFPTVSYWLSVIPVEAMIRQGVEWLCCVAVPDHLAKVTVTGSGDPNGPGANRVSIGVLQQFVSFLQGADLPTRFLELTDRTKIVRSTATAALRQLAPTELPPPPPPPFAASSIVGQSADKAAATLSERGIEVRRAPFDPKADLHTITSAFDILRDPMPGRRVTLFEQDGRVRYYTVSPTDPAHRLRGEVASLRESFDAQSGEVEELRRSLAEREAELAEVRGQLDAVRQASTELSAALPERLSAIEAELTRLRTKPPSRAPRRPRDPT